jgi:quaternary ammonium compound-resistance protein SugE
MAWVLLMLAGVFEVAWAVGLKYTQGFTRLWPSVWVGASMALSLWLLAQATRQLPIGTAYAVWTGIGAFGTAVAGMYFFGEPRDLPRVVSLLLIGAGIVGLRLSARGTIG